MNKKYSKYASTFFIVVPMTFIMAFVGLMRNYGFGPDWFIKFMRAWVTMIPFAYGAAFLIIPQAMKLTQRLIKKETISTKN